MCKLLLLGVNTRNMVKSALELGYEVYSSSYYKTYDFNYNISEKHVLNQKSNVSCEYFEEKFSPMKILDNSKEYLDIVDYIILCSGVSPSDFKGKYRKYVKKIIGNVNVKNVEDKFLFYKKVCSEFLVPDTFNVNDIDETCEIIKNDKDSEYILKPVNGSGGYGVYSIKYNDITEFKMNDKIIENFDKNQWILQRKIKGTNISSSVLSTKTKTKNMINSRLLNQNEYNMNSYKYGGNILPLTEKTIKIYNTKENTEKINIENINRNIKNISEKIIKKLKLIGNNGVDMILTPENEIYIIEVNPRLQGTYECIEELLKINLLNAHIKACNDELIEIPQIKNEYCFKRVIYTNKKTKIGNINNKNIYDIPYPNVIIEKEQPLVTIITKGNKLKDVCSDNIKTKKELENNIKELNS